MRLFYRSLPLLAGLAVLLGATGCGDDEASQATQDQRLASARDEANRQRELDDQLRRQEAEKERLKRKLDAIRRRNRENAQTTPSSTPPPPPTAAGGSTACGGGLTVGPNTSCPFARNVRDAYNESGGDSVVSVYSPVTGQRYTMTCSPAGALTACRGGNNASVFFD
ncbi:MAG TPA: hypothetical protein VF549_10845 [Solirubrobacteraceae bacterium]|jgi:hypothetical protein